MEKSRLLSWVFVGIFLKKIRYTRSDQKSSTKKSTKIYIAPLAQGTEPKNITYHTISDVTIGSSFLLFWHCESFVGTKFYPKSPLSFVWRSATECMLKNPKRSLVSFFWHCESFVQTFFKVLKETSL